MLTIAAAGLIALTATLGAAPAKAPPPADQLYGVSCPSANDCVAVGINENAETSGGGALIQSWNGRTWTSVAPKAPKGALSTDLLGVSCATAKSCVAVGLYLNSGGVGVPLAETWNGKTWTPGTPARPKGSGGQLDDGRPRRRRAASRWAATRRALAGRAGRPWNGQLDETAGAAAGQRQARRRPDRGVLHGSARNCVAVGSSTRPGHDGGGTPARPPPRRGTARPGRRGERWRPPARARRACSTR